MTSWALADEEMLISVSSPTTHRDLDRIDISTTT